jgi:hypothetical protein
MTMQEKQRCKITLPLHVGGKDTFRTNRMPEAACIPSIRGQTIRIFGNHAAFGRKPGSAYLGYKFS